MTKNGITTQYTYDLNNRLLTKVRTLSGGTVETTTFTYDANGNQLTSFTGVTRQGGNNPGSLDIVAQGEAAPDGGRPAAEARTYNALNRLIRVVNGSHTVEYTYRPDGLRARTTKTIMGSTGSEEVITDYVWDGGYTQTPKNGGMVSAVIVADITDGVITTYIRGRGNELIAAVTGGV